SVHDGQAPFSLTRQGGGDGLGVDRGDFEQGSGGSFRPSTPLLPILQRGHADADHAREFGLGLAEPTTNRPDVRRRELGYPARLDLSASDAAGLTNTAHQVVEVFLPHPNSSRTSRDRTRSCWGVRFSWTFLRNV